MTSGTKWAIGVSILLLEVALVMLGWNWINRPATSTSTFNPISGERAPKSVWGADTIDVDEAAQLYCDGAVFLDVQSATSHARGAIPNADWIDYERGMSRSDLAHHAGPDDKIVVYCENDRCWNAYRAVKDLIDWAMPEVYYFRGGLVEWNANRYAIQTSMKGKKCKQSGWSPKGGLPKMTQ